MVADTAADTPALEFRHVSVSFGEVQALEDVSFVLRRGQMICVTGDAGSGKSVLCQLAIGLLEPDEGEILIEGQNIVGLDERELLAIRARLMGIVFQEAALFTSLSVYDNTAYRLAEHGWPEAETERAVLEILRFVGLEAELDKSPEELSGGMKRRLEIARALVGWPSIMLFDEPTAGLDPINERQVMDLIIRARDIYQISSLYVTKALEEIPYLAMHGAVQDQTGAVSVRPVDGRPASDAQVMLLETGKIAFFGSPQEFEASPLPAVRHMTHPVTGERHSGLSPPDPWGNNQKFKRKLL